MVMRPRSGHRRVGRHMACDLAPAGHPRLPQAGNTGQMGKPQHPKADHEGPPQSQGSLYGAECRLILYDVQEELPFKYNNAILAIVILIFLSCRLK